MPPNTELASAYPSPTPSARISAGNTSAFTIAFTEVYPVMIT